MKETTLPKVAVIATGGTISCKVDPATGKTVAALTGADLLASLPGSRPPADLELTEFSRIQSTNMHPEQMFEIARAANGLLARPDIAGCVVTHGTSAMEESSYMMDLLLKGDKPVVFTGAMYSAQAPDSDGPRNIESSIRVAASPQARGKGALICMEGEIHAARDAAKMHKSSPHTFVSFDHGALGRVDEDKVIFYRQPLLRRTFEVERIESRVDLIKVVAGSDDRFIRTSVETGAVGIVVEGMPGRGNVPSQVADGIRWARQRGMVVVLAGRAPEGRVLAKYGGGGGVMDLVEMGVILAGDLVPTKARILLMVALAWTRDEGELRRIFAEVAP